MPALVGVTAKVANDPEWTLGTANCRIAKAYSITSSARARIDCGSWLPRKALRRRPTAIRPGNFLKYKSMPTL
jgi:hypothetical protein